MFQLNIISYGGPFTAHVSSTEYILDVIFLEVSLLLSPCLSIPLRYSRDLKPFNSGISDCETAASPQ